MDERFGPPRMRRMTCWQSSCPVLSWFLSRTTRERNLKGIRIAWVADALVVEASPAIEGFAIGPRLEPRRQAPGDGRQGFDGSLLDHDDRQTYFELRIARSTTALTKRSSSGSLENHLR